MKTNSMLLLMMILWTATAAAQSSTPLVRELYVPLDDLHVLLEAGPKRVFLRRDEYEALLRKAQRPPDEELPCKLVLMSAEYHAGISQGRARLDGTLRFEVLAPGIHRVPLPIDGVGIRAARLDDAPAPLGRAEDGTPELFIEGVGRHVLTLEMVAPLETTAATQTLRAQLPPAPAAVLHCQVAGNVELRSGAAVVSRRVDTQNNETAFELVPPRGRWSLVFTLNNRQSSARRIVSARAVLVDEITQAYERLHAGFSFEILHGSTDQFRFEIPPGFEITEITSPLLARWEVEDAPGRRVLDVRLREPVSGTAGFNVSATRNRGGASSWSLPQLQPLDVHHQASVVGVLIEDRLSAEFFAPAGLIPIDTGVLRTVLPDSVFRADAGAPLLHPAIAYYAPGVDFDLQARIRKPPAETDVQLHFLVRIEEEKVRLRAGLTLTPTVERLFTLELAVPTGWRVDHMETADGRSLSFAEHVARGGEAGGVRVPFPRSIAPGESFSIRFNASYSPNGWLEEWSEKTLAVPRFQVVQARRQQGAIALEAGGDFQIRPLRVAGLAVLDEKQKSEFGLASGTDSQAYRFFQPDYAATFRVQRTTPAISARVFNFLSLAPVGLSAHYEVIYDISQARTRLLSFRLPADTPRDVQIRGLDGAAIKQTTSEEEAGRRRWLVRLADAHRGQVRLAVDFQRPLGAGATGLDLPLLVADGVTYQTSVVAVEGSAELDVAVQTDGRKLDVGELVDADYEVGRRLLGVFGFNDPAPTVRTRIAHRPEYGLPAAIIERCELVTLVAARGLSQTAVRYLLRTKAAYLQVTLPAGSELWSARVDGRPAAPQRDGEHIVLSLPPGEGRPLRDLQVVFQSPPPDRHWLRQVEAAAPQLAVRGRDQGDGYPVPMADVQWQLVLPDDQQLVRTTGTVFRDRSDPLNWPLATVGHVLYQLAGGIHPFYLDRKTDSLARGVVTSTPREEFVDQIMFEDGARTFKSAEPRSRPATAANSTDIAGADREQEGGQRQRASVAVDEDTVGALDQAGYWAMEGVRSLPVDLDQKGQRIRLHSMGGDPRLLALLLDRRQLDFLSWAVALVVLAVGSRLAFSPWQRQVSFVVFVLATLLLLPLAIRSATGVDLDVVFQRGVYAACLLIPLDLTVRLVRRFAASVTSPGWLPLRRTVGLLLLAAALAPAQADAQSLRITDGLLPLIRRAPPVAIPDDAVVLPYDSSDPEGAQRAEQVLVPYEKYLELWQLAYPDETDSGPPPPATYAWAGASYRARLAAGNELLVEGTFDIELFVDEDVEVPLPLENAVLTRSTVDGQPARVRALEPALPSGRRERVVQPAGPLLVVHASGRGRKRLELGIRIRLGTSGAWRIADCRLPVAPATEMELLVSEAAMEVHLRNVPDRAVYETDQPDTRILTTLPIDGRLRLEWRPRVSRGQVDQTLTAESAASLDIQEDGVRLTWQFRLDSRSANRESFAFLLPAGFLVEEVSGDNVRGWEPFEDGEARRVEVTLLEAAAARQTVQLRLWSELPLGDEAATQIDLPVVSVPDAALHRGYLLIRRSPRLDVRTLDSSGLQRAETDAEDAISLTGTQATAGPLGLRSHQAWRFNSAGFHLRMSVEAYRAVTSVETKTLVKLAREATSVEAQLDYQVRNRPLYESAIELPQGFELEQVSGPQGFDWMVASEQSPRILRLKFHQGLEGSFSLVVQGRVPPAGPDRRLAAPRLRVLGAASQTGSLVAQTDPSWDLRAVDLQNCQTVLLENVRSWLDQPQRQLARLAIAYQRPNFAATLQLVPKSPRVSQFSVTNVRITPHEIQTTVYLQFTIREAGIREVAFRLPVWFRDAQITAPLLRQQSFEPVPDRNDQFRVRLELQDEIIDHWTVVIQLDRALRGDVIEAPIPTIEGGRTDQRYVVLENVGRDEIVLDEVVRVRELSWQDSEWKRLSGILNAPPTRAFLVADQTAEPKLTLRRQQRAVVRTAEARIRLAEALLLVDGNGTFRGRQVFHIDNKTEQYLELELPHGAKLWTATVAGRPVKPGQAAEQSSATVRIPLLKTAAGDLDYEVEIKYGGQLPAPGRLRRSRFPLIRTVNVHVEQSQVRLRLPETHRWWDFGGSMRPVRDQGVLAAEFLSYQTRQIESLQRVLTSKESDQFSKVRAATNLARAVESSSQYRSFALGRYGDANVRLQRELVANSLAQQDAQQQILGMRQEVDRAEVTRNRDRLLQLGASQATELSANAVLGLGQNFAPVELQDQRPTDSSAFAVDWFSKRQLANESEPVEQSRRRLAERRNATAPAVEGAGLDLGSLGDKKDSPVSEPQLPALRDELQEQVRRYQQRLEQTEQRPGSGPATDQRFFPGQSSSEANQPLSRTDAAAPATDEPHAARGTGWSSLELSLPERGVEYLFTTPRGDVEVTARAIAVPQLDNGLRLAGILALVIGVSLITQLIRRIQRSWSRSARAALLVSFGAISLAGFLPVLGLAAVGGGVWLWLRR